MSEVKVSIIVVYYSNLEKFKETLNSIYDKNWNTKFEVIAVNNAAMEIPRSLKRKFPKVFFIKSPKNGGYGYGNNLGARQAKGEFLFILNPDTKLQNGSLDKLTSFLDTHPEVVIVAPNLVTTKGKLFPQMGSAELTPFRGIVVLSFINSLFPKNPVSQKYWLTNIPKNKLREVGVVPGSAFMIRRNLFEKIGGFDEKFFLFFEESDLCKRVRESGYKIFIYPEAQVEHSWTNRKATSKRVEKAFTESRFYFFRKHYGLVWAIVVEVFARFSPKKAISYLR